LIGAPPGYVGYDEGGQLTEAVRRRPFSVVLFDEIEKAAPDVFNVFLQILDEGHLTDGQGRRVDFKNTILIMTSNIGSTRILDFSGAGGAEYAVMRATVLDELRRHFRPEFLNRVDEIVVFQALSEKQLESIVELQLGRLRSRLTDRRIELDVSEAALRHLVKVGYDPVYGARPLKRAIQRELETRLRRLRRERGRADLHGRLAQVPGVPDADVRVQRESLDRDQRRGEPADHRRAVPLLTWDARAATCFSSTDRRASSRARRSESASRSRAFSRCSALIAARATPSSSIEVMWRSSSPTRNAA
jgi:hypothetical protein